MPNASAKAHVDINHGVDFEIELEELQAAAGKAFHTYRDLKLDPDSTDAQINDARQAYIDAQGRVRAHGLSRDTDGRIGEGRA